MCCWRSSQVMLFCSFTAKSKKILFHISVDVCLLITCISANVCLYCECTLYLSGYFFTFQWVFANILSFKADEKTKGKTKLVHVLLPQILEVGKN